MSVGGRVTLRINGIQPHHRARYRGYRRRGWHRDDVNLIMLGFLDAERITKQTLNRTYGAPVMTVRDERDDAS